MHKTHPNNKAMTPLQRPKTLCEDVRGASTIMHKDATLHIKLQGHNLTNVATGFFRGRVSAPVFDLCAYENSLDEWKAVATSESVGPELANPSWPGMAVPCQALCRCDLERPIQIQLWDEAL